MAALSAGLLAASIGSQYFAQRDQAKAAIAQGTYQGAVADQNAQLARLQSADAISRGQTAALQRIGAGRVEQGAIRAAAGGSGVAGNTGSFSDLTAQSLANQGIDVAQINQNAAREAWGYNVDAQQATQQGQLARASGRNTAAALRAGAWGTLLTGAAQGYGMYDQWKRNQPPGFGKVPTAPRGGYNVVRK